MIELKHVNKTYYLQDRHFQALQNINLMIKQGEIFGIFGESGAGKSTLLRTINLLEKPTSGQVLLDGVDIMAIPTAALNAERRKIGMIFQHFNLLQSRTVYENIALPLELHHIPSDKIEQEVNKLLALVKLQEHKNHYPDQLSGGQKQRVAIARALASNPQVLLCDEPTSALDPNSTASVLSLLKEINRQFNVTIVLITHEMNVIKQICDRAGVMDKGKLVEMGSIIDLFAHPKTTITQQLVQKSLHIELPEMIQQKLQSTPHAGKSMVVRFTFVGEDSNKPLITTLVKKFNIVVNIIQADVESIQDSTVGFTVCELSGEYHAIQAALQYIEPLSVTVEVLGYV